MTHHPPTRILVGVDFSPESDAAVAHAVAIARASGAEIVLVHACTVPEPPPAIADYVEPTLGEFRRRLEDDVAADRAKLDALCARAAAQGVVVRQRVADGFPDTTITGLARELGADLTVVGTHGRTALKWLLLGSVAQRVVRLADADVLVARGEPAVGGYRRICLATDFSPISELALEAALDLAHLGAEIEVVHMWHLTPALGLSEPARLSSLSDWRGSLEEEIRAAGARLLAAHRRPGITLSFEPTFEPVLPGLLDRIGERGYDLTVVGSHGRRGFRRFVLGSVAEEVARRAPTSVLVVHGGERGAAEAAA
jgi:nucleotide-binding universal stress UspA family protein